jgi:hypothetical protein
MDRFILTVKTTNAAFEDDAPTEVARLLRDVAERLEDGSVSGKMRDVNGNTVGDFGFTTEE